MPRRAGGGRISAPPARSFSSGPPRPAPAAAYPARPTQVPAHAPAAAPMAPAAAAPKQPGMFAQMATTAAGVAVGSAVGHTIGAAMTGGGGGHQEAAPQAAAPPAPQYQQYQPQAGEGGPCSFEVKQFLECAQNQHDISLCQGFNEAIRQCKMNNGIQV